MTMDRKLALKISCISEEDRKWILRQLSGDEVSQLQPLLEEIEQLGLNKDPSIVREVLESVKDSPGEPKINKTSVSDRLRHMDKLDPYWQKIILVSLDQKDAKAIMQKNNIDASLFDAINKVPSSLASALVQYVSEQKHVN
ncbi:hypothetical protein TDB9533_02884 [Thalassocella blandensis]|nr:hypothetical protein TDB9533_02884 [Thalassocella blandensis]